MRPKAQEDKLKPAILYDPTLRHFGVKSRRWGGRWEDYEWELHRENVLDSQGSRDGGH